MTSLKIRALFAVVLLLNLMTVPTFAQTDAPTAEPVATEAAPELSAGVESASNTDQLVRVVEVLVILIGALVGSSIVVLGGIGLVLVRFGLTIAGLLASLTPSQRDDALVKQLTQAFDERYPDTPRDPGRPQ